MTLPLSMDVISGRTPNGGTQLVFTADLIAVIKRLPPVPYGSSAAGLRRSISMA